MKRVLVVGSGGSGKSTFARLLGEITGLPVIHLDRLYWRSGWVKADESEWMSALRSELDKDAWIMDGNFGATRLMRLKACDTVVFLDLPRWLCLARVLKRSLWYHGRSRPDMAEGCNEKIDLEFLGWIWNYPKRGKRTLTDELKGFPEKNIVILRSRREVSGYLKALKKHYGTG